MATCKWTEQEIATIRANAGMDAKELASLLPGRSHAAVMQKRAKLGGTYFGCRWTDEETQYLRDHRYDSTEDVAKALGRSVDTIFEKRVKFGLRALVDCPGCGTPTPKRNQHSCCPSCAKPNSYFNGTVEGRYRAYKFSAKKRGHAFGLTLDEFAEFKDKPCDYCGDAIDGIGIDRVDNAIGYTKANCVPCCETCNRMKLTMDRAAWLSHMQKILKNVKGH